MKQAVLILLGALALGCGGGYTPPDPGTPEGRAVISADLATLAGFIDTYGSDTRSDEVAKALRIVSGWVRDGFRGDPAQLRDAIRIVRASLAEVQNHGVAIPEQILSVIAMVEAWLSGAA